MNVYNIGTNGTILPNEDILNSIVRNGVNVSISNYGASSHRFSELKTLLSSHEIAYDTSADGMTWFSMQANTPHSDEEAQARYDKCTWGKGVPLLRNGYAHVCGYSGTSWRLGYHKPDAADYVYLLDDITSVAQRRAQITEMLDKRTYCAACKVCGWGFDSKLLPGEQI